MELYIQDILKRIQDMDSESKFGQMVQNMREYGKIIKQMEKENFGILMEMFMKAIGSMIKPKGKVLIFMQITQSIQANGKMTCRMGME